MRRNNTYFVFILLILFAYSLSIFSQENNKDNNNGNNNNENNIIKQINENFDSTGVKKTKNDISKSNNIKTSSILFRTFLISFILLLIFIIIKFFFSKYSTTNIKSEIATILYEEYFYKNSKIGIMKSFDHYFLVSLTPKLSILYEFTKKEDIDNILLLQSKKNEQKKSFKEFLKGVTISNRQNMVQNVTDNDFLKNLKQKINNISRSKDE